LEANYKAYDYNAERKSATEYCPAISYRIMPCNYDM